MHVNCVKGVSVVQIVEVSPVSLVTLIIIELLQGLSECRTCCLALVPPVFVSQKQVVLILIFVCLLM